jgi:hypothetical protein
MVLEFMDIQAPILEYMVFLGQVMLVNFGEDSKFQKVVMAMLELTFRRGLLVLTNKVL